LQSGNLLALNAFSLRKETTSSVTERSKNSRAMGTLHKKNFAMRDPETEQPHQRRQQIERSKPRAPFDSSELNNIPRPTDEDPPYRNWWVVTEPDPR
jgi:hypothetical protein